jgi:hypothetical protein
MAFDYKKEGWSEPMLSIGKLDPENKGQIQGDPYLTVHTTGGGLLGKKENSYSEEQAIKILDAVKKSLRDDKSVPKELFSKMMELNPSDYAGFFGGEDFGEELNVFQSLISKNYRQREDGRYVFDDSLLLKEGQTPRGWVKDSYGFGTPVPQQEGQELFGIKPEG